MGGRGYWASQAGGQEFDLPQRLHGVQMYALSIQGGFPMFHLNWGCKRLYFGVDAGDEPKH